MTRVAILEPDPRICGPASWSGHVKKGLQGLGHEVEVVTPMKSGKPRTRWGVENPQPGLGGGWSSWMPDAIPKFSAVVQYLQTFDFIVLPEPKSAHLDKEVEPGTLPIYGEWLRDSGVPFITALHGPQYDANRWAKHVPEIFALPNFIPALITSQTSFADTNEALLDPRLRYVEHALPYAPACEVDAPVAYGSIVGFTGRMTWNLGPQLLAAAAEDIHCPDIEMHGSGSIGLGPNVTYLLWKFMCDRGWDGTRQTLQLKCTGCKRKYDGATLRPGGLTCEDCGYVMTAPLWPLRWTVSKNGHNVSYGGPFASAVETCKRLLVHVDLTGHDYTYGLEKFTTLEAMDAGSLPVIPEHLNVNGFTVASVAIDQPKGLPRIDRGEADEQLAQVAGAVNRALHLPDETRTAIVQSNRARLRDINDPTNFCRVWLKEAGLL